MSVRERTPRPRVTPTPRREREVMDETPDPVERSFSGELKPRGPRKHYYEILRPGPGCEVSAIVTSDLATVTRSHYYRETTYFCLHDPSIPATLQDCPFCSRGWMPKIKGYLCGVKTTGARAVAIELTDNALFHCPIINDRRENLRGKLVTLYRKGKARNSPVFLTVSDAHNVSVIRRLPPPFDLREFLRAMWTVPRFDTLPGEFFNR